MAIIVKSEKIYELVKENTKLEKLEAGFQFTEGPLWNSQEQSLLFSDIPGNVIYKWSEKGLEKFRSPSNMANGLTYDNQLNLIACEHATSRITRTNKNGDIQPVATHFRGKELNSPNDVVVKSDGTIYFSDPGFGRLEFFGVPREQELNFQGVYRMKPEEDRPELLVEELEAPNGLCFSPDEKSLYINDTAQANIRLYDVNADGTLSNETIFFEMETSPDSEGVPDGMKVDETGNVYCTGPFGIWVISPEGEYLGTIQVPEKVANFNWGGKDWNILYITASTSIYRFPMKVKGNTLPYMEKSSGANFI